MLLEVFNNYEEGLIKQVYSHISPHFCKSSAETFPLLPHLCDKTLKWWIYFFFLAFILSPIFPSVPFHIPAQDRTTSLHIFQAQEV